MRTQTTAESKVGEDGKSYTNQTVNPEMTKKIDEFYEVKKGVSMLHEVLESYIGGAESPGVGAPTLDETETPERTAYLNAHNKAELLDTRHKASNIVAGDIKDGIFISKFPYNDLIPKYLNPEILINNLKK